MDEVVEAPADAAPLARGGSHGIWKVVVRSSVLCAWFSSGGMEETAGRSYETRMQFLCRGSGLTHVSFVILSQARVSTW